MVVFAAVDQSDVKVRVPAVDGDVDDDLGHGPLAAIAYDVAAAIESRLEPCEYVLSLVASLVPNLTSVAEQATEKPKHAKVCGAQRRPVKCVVMAHSATIRRKG
jgi:hypothetical protein